MQCLPANRYHSFLPDRPFHNFWASKSVAKRSWTTYNPPIFWFWGSEIVKRPVGLLAPFETSFFFLLMRLFKSPPSWRRCKIYLIVHARARDRRWEVLPANLFLFFCFLISFFPLFPEYFFYSFSAECKPVWNPSIHPSSAQLISVFVCPFVGGYWSRSCTGRGHFSEGGGRRILVVVVVIASFVIAQFIARRLSSRDEKKMKRKTDNHQSDFSIQLGFLLLTWLKNFFFFCKIKYIFWKIQENAL